MNSNRTSIKRLLLLDLKIAEHELSQFSGGYSGKFDSAENFHKTLKRAITDFELGDESVINDLWNWFAPTCDWDDLVGDLNLGNRIFERLKELK